MDKFFEAKRLFSIGESAHSVALLVRVDKYTALKWKNMGLEPWIPSVPSLKFLAGADNKAYRMVEMEDTA